MRNYINEFGKEVALDGEWEMDYSATERTIKELKFTYARKNSRRACKISFRADIVAPEPIFWKYYLQCWVEGELKSNYRIKEEVYNLYSKNKTTQMLCAGLEYFLYYEFIPILNKILIPSEKKETQKKKKFKSNYLLDVLLGEDEQIIADDTASKKEIKNTEIRPEQLLINIL